MTNSIVQIRGVSKSYRRDSMAIPVLHDITLDVPEGEFFALMGPSGSGKTTLLNLIAGIDRPDAGSVAVAGTDVTKLSESQLAKWRATHIGDRKSTRLNSSHLVISYAVFCLKKKKKYDTMITNQRNALIQSSTHN